MESQKLIFQFNWKTERIKIDQELERKITDL